MKAFIINLVVLFFVKVIDNMLATSKTLLVQKNKALLASITVILSQIIFYKLIDKTIPNMIQIISKLFAIKPLISKGI